MNNIFKSLKKTRKNIANALSFVSGKKYLTPKEIDEFEELLILSDIDIDIVDEILSSLEEKINKEINLSIFISDKIKESIASNSYNCKGRSERVLNIVGVNGAGKTTFCAKIAKLYKNKGLKVCIIAGDTYRAAAVDQLKIWSEKLGVKFISNPSTKDPASIVYD